MSNPIEEAMEALGDVILRGINGLEIELEFAQHEAETWSARAVEAEARVAELEASGGRFLSAGIRSLLEDCGITPSGTGSEDLGLLEIELQRHLAAQTEMIDHATTRAAWIRMLAEECRQNGRTGPRDALDHLLSISNPTTNKGE